MAHRILVSGLVGGHSGLDIDKNRANAIKCLARVLHAVDAAGLGYRLHKIHGGSMRNAVPREAFCGGCLDPAEVGRLRAAVAGVADELREEYAATDPGLTVTVEPRPGCGCEASLTASCQRRVIDGLLANPSSVAAMSPVVPGLVETSNNLGVVRTADGVLEVVNCTRSSRGSALEALRHSVAAVWRMAGAEIVMEASYPGWQPDLASPLLALARQVHAAHVGKAAEIKAVHAGLECGLVGRVYPGLEMISIGPTIVGAHSPDERVHVPSVGVFYGYLKALLAAL